MNIKIDFNIVCGMDLNCKENEIVQDIVKDTIKELEEKIKSSLESKKEWVPEIGKLYYKINAYGEVVKSTFTNFSIGRNCLDIGNAFRTKEEAQFELERRKIEAIMKKYSRSFEHEEENYYIFYAYSNKSICISSRIRTDDGIPYFESKKMAQKVIDKIGEERLKKYWFRVEK
ncbi:hypothetical protein [Peptostreptococcus porci]|uniref:hypothetical protein n=1 Tax=Peptostreptococcus porci TaxID=2652282 RepID=UPI002A89644B|nr:hypothetical protein [Peptostreptococcus porci]MDY4561377.1 hypothetical protein [Peptostreptococcus porci]MDY5437151.1 hypothetical protein [Peptostreptococcus porci]